MEEKKVVQKQVQEQPLTENRTYTPPSLTVYGKLTELTGGGTISFPEAGPGMSDMSLNMMT
jgi:hypothetical protein